MIKNYKDEWQEIKDTTMTTIGKTTGKYPEKDWKIKLLISEHSPIRKLKISWKWESIKSWVSVHFVRHKFGIEHWVSTRRTDRTGIDRNELRQDELVTHEFEANAQAIINISRKRMCFQASKETREAWAEFLDELEKKEPELRLCCVPEGIYRGGCPEFNNCGHCGAFLEKNSKEDYLNIKKRYEDYKNRTGDLNVVKC